jgi:hypothetical protein
MKTRFQVAVFWFLVFGFRFCFFDEGGVVLLYMEI